jgi:hypothetical protein
LDCRIRSTPPPLMPEKATSSKVRPAALGRPPRSSACTARTPNVQLRLRTRAPCLFPLVTGPSLRALVSRNRWFLLRPVVSPLVLASSGGFAAGSSLVRRLRRWFLLHPAALPLVLGSSGGFAAGSCFIRRLRRWFLAGPADSPLVLLRRLVSAGPALAHTPQSSGRFAAGFLCLSPPLTSSVPPLGLCVREFHWNSASLVQFHTRGCIVLTVPRVR